MYNVLRWIKQHLFIVVCIAIVAFVLPLVIVHILFKSNWHCPWLVAEWSSGELLGYIAGFEAFLGTVTLGVLALWQNEDIQRQHIESMQPALSMRLLSISGFLYLLIENTGATEATNIHVTLKSIINNGECNELTNDDLFSTSFELYPKEMVQGKVAVSGENIVTHTFPQISIRVSYIRPDTGALKEYDRTVTYNCGYNQKIVADINYDNRILESDIDKIARANVRIANYLDGHQVAKFDALDLLSGKSFRNDLSEAIKTGKSTPIVSREESIKKSYR